LPGLLQETRNKNRLNFQGANIYLVKLLLNFCGLSIYLSIYLSILLSIFLFIYMSIYFLSKYFFQPQIKIKKMSCCLIHLSLLVEGYRSIITLNLYECLFLCLKPIKVKTAEQIGSTFFVVPQWRSMEFRIEKNCLNKFRFLKINEKKSIKKHRRWMQSAWNPSIFNLSFFL